MLYLVVVVVVALVISLVAVIVAYRALQAVNKRPASAALKENTASKKQEPKEVKKPASKKQKQQKQTSNFDRSLYEATAKKLGVFDANKGIVPNKEDRQKVYEAMGLYKQPVKKEVAAKKAATPKTEAPKSVSKKQVPCQVSYEDLQENIRNAMRV